MTPTATDGAPGARVVVEAPPALPDVEPPNALARLMPLAMVVATVGMTALYLTSGSARNPAFLMFPLMMVASVVGTLAHGVRGRGSRDLDRQRAAYLRRLAATDDLLADLAAAEHRRLHTDHPDPACLWSATYAGRSTEHPEFCCLRIGLGEQSSRTQILAPPLPTDEAADPVTVGAVRRLLAEHATLADVPVLLDLRRTRLLTVTGDPAAVRGFVRALVCQFAVTHPADLVALDVAGSGTPHWEFLKWVPHLRRPGGAHRVIVLDGAPLPPPDPHVTTIQVEPAAPGSPLSVTADAAPLAAAWDQLGEAEATAVARRLGGCPTAAPGHRAHTDWPALMGLDPDALDAAHEWSRRRPALRVPIGVTDDGARVDLDINETAAGGIGPHGLCVGATGSGKSEFLRTLTLGMIAAHPPEALNLVLVDFKGGATFLGLDRARHVSAVITNLAQEASLVARMRDALTGEITRRQELLRAAGHATGIAQYAARRPSGAPPLPVLFIVVDEFSELLSQHPDFADLFVAIGRLGRSLGMHLLLASQRLDEGRLRGLETHLSYRICLKTFSAADSRAVLGVADAYHLPAAPGAAYLKTASGELTRFQTAFVSGPYATRGAERDAAPTAAVRRFTLADRTPRRTAPAASQRTLLDTVLTAVEGRGAAAHRVWLPPLHQSPDLDDLLDAIPHHHLRVPLGLVDCPAEQLYDILTADLAGAAGHVAVIGAPRTGKTTALQTLVRALAATHDPGDVHVYCLDYGGGGLAALADLPHVGAIASRADVDLTRRIVAHVQSLARARDGAGAGEPHVFLVIDGWAGMRQDHDTLEPAVTALATHGLSVGIHVVLASGRWADLRPALKDQIGTRIELRLGDPADSEMDRRAARTLADRPAGRGLTREGRETALARPSTRRICRRDDGGGAPPVELLPDRIALSDLTATARPPHDIRFALGEHALTPVGLDFLQHPHLLVLGDGQCGKTAALRSLCTALTRTLNPSQAQLEIVDYRRTLLGAVDTDHVAGYAVSGTALAGRLASLMAVLTARLPDEHVTQQQLRTRSWWSGPEIYLVVDDYDLVAGATGNPLTPLADVLPHAGDIGLHLVVARRSGGAARAMFDPVLARMRDMGCSGLMMSASPEEGVLLGTARPTALPPGRGTLLVRGRPDELVQIGWVEPP